MEVHHERGLKSATKETQVHKRKGRDLQSIFAVDENSAFSVFFSIDTWSVFLFHTGRKYMSTHQLLLRRGEEV
jgi:hypothetical protein